MGDWLVIILWKQQDRNRLSSYNEKKKNAWAVFSLLPPVDGISIEASKNHVGRACASNFLSLLAISVMQVCILLLAISVMLLQVSTPIAHWPMWLCLLMPADREAAVGHVVNVTTTWSGRRQPSRSNLQARSVASAARTTASGVEMCSISYLTLWSTFLVPEFKYKRAEVKYWREITMRWEKAEMEFKKVELYIWFTHFYWWKIDYCNYIMQRLQTFVLI